MSIAVVRVSSSHNEKTTKYAHPEKARGNPLTPVGLIGFGSFATFLLAVLVLWAISILLGIL
jgi:hypothetical protein